MTYAKTPVPDFLSVHSILTVHRIKFDKNATLTGESHPFPEMFFVADDKHSICVDNEVFELSSGQMLIYAPDAYHISAGPSSATVYIISFEAVSDILPQLYNRVITLNSEQRAMLAELISAGIKMFEKLPPDSEYVGMRKKDDVTDCDLQKFRNKLELWLIDIYREEVHSDAIQKASNHENLEREQFEGCVKFLREHIDDALTLDEIAASSHISVSKLSAIFRHQCGCGAIAYFNEMKIERAKRLIRDSSMNFTQISQNLGFCTVHYFSKLFKKIIGMTPSEYARIVNKA